MRADLETIACPLCTGGQFEFLFEKQGEPFVRCRDCTLVLINPRPRGEAVADTYDAAYSHGYIDKADKKRARARRWVAAAVRRLGRSRGRWLDIGCSAGFILEAARAAGFEVHGVELEGAAVRFARETLGLTDVQEGTFEAQRYPDHHFDVVSLYDVIEHVPDLQATVSELARVVRPDGLIEIRTPDVSHWRRPRQLSAWKEIKPSEHLYYFSPATLTRLLAQHGLDLRHRRWLWKPALHACYAPVA